MFACLSTPKPPLALKTRKAISYTQGRTSVIHLQYLSRLCSKGTPPFLLLSLIFTLGLPGTLQGTELNPEVVAKVRAATVYVSTPTSTGSGFLIARDGKSGYVATNEHVLRNSRNRIARRIQIVLYSGTPQAVEVRAEVVALDSEGDLAVLKITHTDGLPAPLSLNSLPEPKETMSVFALGFPFGQALSLRKDSPGITFTPGSISSLRRSDEDVLRALQLDMNLNPGNSGGPLIDEQGNLIGINVATLLGTQISWAIPATQLKKLSEGNALNPVWNRQVDDKGNSSYKLSLQLQDPMEQIKEIQVAVLMASSKKVEGNNWKKLPEGTVFKLGEKSSLTRSGARSAAGVLKMPDDFSPGNSVLYEVALEYRDGRKRFLPLGRKILAIETATAEEQELKRIKLLDPANAFAVNPNNGDLLAASESSLSLHLYPRAYLEGDHDESLIRSLDLSTRPVSIVFKQYLGASLYAVICLQDPHLYLLDPETLEILDKIPMTEDGQLPGSDEHASMFASQVNSALVNTDPNIYVAYGSGHDARLGSYDLQQKEFLPKLTDRVMDFGISAGGNVLYRRGPYSPSGFGALHRDPAPGKNGWVTLYSEHRSTPPYVTDIYGQYVAAGQDLFTFNLGTKVHSFPWDVMCFVPDRPLIIGLDKNRLKAASLNTFQAVGSVELPEDVAGLMAKQDIMKSPNPHRTYKRYLYERRVIPVPSHRELYVCADDQLLRIPLRLFPDTEEPLLVGDIAIPRYIQFDEEHHWFPETPNTTAKITFPLLPDFANFDGEKLVLKPDIRDVGPQKLQMKLEENGFSYTRDYSFDILTPFFYFDFRITGVETDPRGRYAVVWSEQDSRTRKTHVRLLDFEQNKVHEIPETRFPVHGAYLTEKWMLLMGTRGQTAEVYSLDDLTPVMKRAMFPEATYHHIGDQLYALKDQTLYEFELPTLESKGSRPVHSATYKNFFEKLGPNLRVNGHIFSAGLEKHLLFLGGGDMEIYDSSQDGSRRLSRNFYVSRLPRWGRQVDNRSLEDENGQDLREFSNSSVALLKEKPLGVSLRTQSLDGRSSRVQAQIFELTKGEVILDTPVGYFPGRMNFARIRPSNEGFVLYEDHFVSRMDLSHLKTPKEPLQLYPKETQPLLPDQGEVQFTHIALGGTPPYRFSLKAEIPGVTLDPESGTLTFDMSTLKAHIHRDQGEIFRLRVSKAGSLESSMKLLDNIVGELVFRGKEKNKMFRLRTGFVIEGMPIGVGVSLKVTDSTGSEKELRYAPFVSVSPAEIMDPMRQELQAKLDEQFLSRNPQQALPPPDDRVRQLEERVEKLEKKIDLLLKLLKTSLEE
jgi:hypothetical protein